MSEKAQNVQDVFLNHLRKNKTPVTIFLVNGVKLQGIVTWFDNFSVLLRRDGQSTAATVVEPNFPAAQRRSERTAFRPRCEENEAHRLES